MSKEQDSSILLAGTQHVKLGILQVAWLSLFFMNISVMLHLHEE